MTNISMTITLMFDATLMFATFAAAKPHSVARHRCRASRRPLQTPSTLQHPFNLDEEQRDAERSNISTRSTRFKLHHSRTTSGPLRDARLVAAAYRWSLCRRKRRSKHNPLTSFPFRRPFVTAFSTVSSTLYLRNGRHSPLTSARRLAASPSSRSTACRQTCRCQRHRRVRLVWPLTLSPLHWSWPSCPHTGMTCTCAIRHLHGAHQRPHA